MQQSILTKIKLFILRNRQNRIFRKFVQVLCCMVVFVTTYALILPAITMEQDAFCGKEAHEHTEECLQPVPVPVLVCTQESLGIHTHSGSCYNADGAVICGQADYVVHSHSDSCYDAAGQLVCLLPERSSHVHGESCYIPGETQPEILHVHSEACYIQEQGELTCTEEEREGHSHGDQCYGPGDLLECTLTEHHVHDASCYSLPLTCSISTEPHVHSENCYGTGNLQCSTPEYHTHTDSCWDRTLSCNETDETHCHDDGCYTANLRCQIPENHAHSSSCYESILVCGKEAGQAHEHNDSCYGTEPQLQCRMPENHVHDTGCYNRILNCEVPEDPGHRHEDACYQWNSVLNCGLEEGQPEPTEPPEPVLACTEPEAPVHVHGDSCFELQEKTCQGGEDHQHTDSCYTCGLEAHAHTLICYSDPDADVESPEVWKATFAHVTLTGDWPTDVVAIAETQLGYTESTRNYDVWEDNSIHGYTRYGAWYGVPYGDWCGMFASFCLRYAGVNDIPINYGVRPWIDDLASRGLYYRASETQPQKGSLIFFDWEGDGLADHVGIVAEVHEAQEHTGASITAIEGNSSNCVKYVSYRADDPVILGYGHLTPVTIDTPLVEEESSAVTGNDSMAAVANIVGQTTYVTRSADMMRMTSPGASGRSTVVTGTTDMGKFIDDVTVYKKQNGAWVEVASGGTVTQGEDLKFTIDYTVVGKTLSDSVNTLVYQVPSNITIAQSSSGSVYNDSKEEVGTFVIDAATRTISITFSDEYVDENQLNKAIDGSISFYATLENITQEGDDKTKIVFSDKVHIDMGVAKKEDVTGDLKVEKSITKVNGAELTYQIKVSSETGTFSDVILTDEMTGGISFKDGFTVTDKNGNNVAYTLDNENSSSKKFIVTLPQMQAGDYYTITYTARLSGLIEGHKPVNNKATVNSTNSENIDISHFAEVDHTFNYINKTGKLKENGSSIEWTIVINEEKGDISGAILEDIMWDTDGSEKYFTGPVKIADSNGTIIHEGVLPYTFLEGSKDTYTVTYTTQHDVNVSGVISVKNRAGLRYGAGNDYFIDDDEVVIGQNNPLSKEGQVLGVDPETGKLLIQWTITLDTTNGPLSANAYIHDEMYDGQYMTYAQLQAMFAAAEKAVSPYGASIGTKLAVVVGTYKQLWDDDIDDSNIYNHFYIQFTDDIPQGHSISFSFTVTADSISDSGSFYNQVSVNDTVYAEGYANYEFNKPTVTKRGIDVNNDYRIVDGELVLNFDELSEVEGEKTIWWRLRLQFPKGLYDEEVILIDTLPEGLELVGTVARIWGSADEQQIMYPDETGYSRVSWYGDHWKGYGVQLQTSTGADGRQVVTYTVEDSTSHLIAEHGHYIDLLIACKFRDDFQWGDPNAVITRIPFTNTVRAESPDGDLLNTDDHTFIINYDKQEEVVSKFGALNDLNELEYAVVLNKNGRDLDPDENIIHVQDVLTYVSPAEWPIQLYLKPGSVNVYDYTGGVKGALITTARYVYNETATGEGDITYTHTLDLTLPDAKPMLLEYVYTVDGEYNENYSYPMLNTCTITGIADGSIGDNYDLEIKVNDVSAEANFDGVTIRKVDSGHTGLYLPGAVFHVYTWDLNTQAYVKVKHPNTSGAEDAHYEFKTDQDGYLVLNGTTMEAVAYNTAYYITEVEAPSGYFKNPDPYYFYIHSADTNQNPYNFPENFSGVRLNTGALIYYENEPDTTEIKIHKKWLDPFDNPITVKEDQVESVSFELWRKLDGVENTDKLYYTYTITPDSNGFWEKVITDLPKGIPNPEDGTQGTLYQYYIKEVTVPGYTVESYDNNEGITTGTITMTNKEVSGYELPKTGGAGTIPYTMAGWMLILLGMAYLMYRSKARGREES